MSQLNNCLKKLKVPVAYGRFKRKQEFPFLITIGAGSTFFSADNNSIFHGENEYRVELYFQNKDESLEEAIENTLATNEFIILDKSEDIYIDKEDCFEVYYTVS
nr:MAG TPA: hypothetical protein [Caudoviricetes sp.]